MCQPLLDLRDDFHRKARAGLHGFGGRVPHRPRDRDQVARRRGSSARSAAEIGSFIGRRSLPSGVRRVAGEIDKPGLEDVLRLLVVDENHDREMSRSIAISCRKLESLAAVALRFVVVQVVLDGLCARHRYRTRAGTISPARSKVLIARSTIGW